MTHARNVQYHKYLIDLIRFPVYTNLIFECFVLIETPFLSLHRKSKKPRDDNTSVVLIGSNQDLLLYACCSFVPITFLFCYFNISVAMNPDCRNTKYNFCLNLVGPSTLYPSLCQVAFV